MNAVLATERPRQDREMMTGLDRSYVNAKLNAWGHWIERHHEDHSYPKQDSISAYLFCVGGGPKGHRILCMEMPERISLTHIRICAALNEAEKHAVYLWYVVRLKEDNTEWTLDEKCRYAGIEYATLRRDLNRARYRFLGLPIPY